MYERSKKNGISGVATQLAVAKICDDEAPGVWNDVQQKIVISGAQTVRSVAELIDPLSEVRGAARHHLRRQPQPAGDDQEPALACSSAVANRSWVRPTTK